MWSTILCLSFVSFTAVSTDLLENVVRERNDILHRELDMMLGHEIELSDSEIKANDIIMDLKRRELDQGFLQPQLFNVSKHFFEYKDVVKESSLFKLIKEMPKGAILHAHDTGLLSPDYVVTLTYWDDLYVCFEEDDLRLLFSKDTPDGTCGTKWQLMRDARYSSGNVEKFDAELRKHFTIVIDNPTEVYTDINVAWGKFQQYFFTTSALFSYKPVWEQYFYDTLKAVREDSVMYIEIRSVLPQLYDLDGNVYDSVETAVSYKEVVDRFICDYPDFYGAKLIYAPFRMVDAKTVREYIKIAKEIKKRLPDFLAGFDLVGQEDKGMPTKDFLADLVEAKSELDFFFHAGETNWYGTDTDENLIDAIVLGSRRIGHGFAISKHPYLIQEIVKRDIALEVNVVSNAVLKLVEDVRNHPLASFLAQDLPVVLSSDDPGVWEADPLSHDFYVTFVGVASRHADLKLLKKLALNSLYYSTVKDKVKIVHDFEIRWTKFIDSVVKDKW
ncbi:adenosine deaminase 2-like [Ostrinia furnacalis]|uniref:adenosine deaminase 2-like n=1 Tax=Ostrinia furnacalis TaxID=93504 RepID=UPI00103ECCAE|nr:adenosine deaminase 2-like [Ostrinia furnacalis]